MAVVELVELTVNLTHCTARGAKSTSTADASFLSAPTLIDEPSLKAKVPDSTWSSRFGPIVQPDPKNYYMGHVPSQLDPRAGSLRHCGPFAFRVTRIPSYNVVDRLARALKRCALR